MKRFLLSVILLLTTAAAQAAPVDKTLQLQQYSTTSSTNVLVPIVPVDGRYLKYTTASGWHLATVTGGGGGGDALTTDPLSQFAPTTSAQLASVLSDEIGYTTGAKVPFIIGSLAIPSGKTFTASNTLTLTGTDGSTLNIGTGGTLGTGAYATIGNYLTTAAAASTYQPFGLVYVVGTTGVFTAYSPASDTDSARGTALRTAVTAATTSGNTVRVGPGTFALGGNRLALSAGVHLEMDAGTVITSTADLATDGCIIYPGNNSRIRGGTVQAVGVLGVGGHSGYQAAIGWTEDAGDSARTGVVVDGVTMIGDTDGFYIQHGTASTAVLRDCVCLTKWDAIVATGNGETPVDGAHVVDVYNPRVVITGPSALAPGIARGIMAGNLATINVYGGSATATNGGATYTAALATVNGGTLHAYGTHCAVSSSNPKYDVTNVSGTLTVAGSSGTGTNGLLLTNGTITYTGAENGSNIASGTVPTARLDTSTGGQSVDDAGRIPKFGAGGGLRAESFQSDGDITSGGEINGDSLAITFGSNIGRIYATNLTTSRDLQLPDNDGTIATQEWASANLGGGGSVATDAIWDAAGDLVYGTGANTGGRLAKGTAFQVLQMNSGATAPQWTSDLSVTSVTAAATTVTSIKPATDDGAALGDTTHNFSDLFLASGAVRNYANGNVVETHSSGILTMGTGEYRITTPGTNSASVPTLGSTSTFTGKTLDAAATGNVLKLKGYIYLTHPHYVDGTGATLTTSATSVNYGHATFSNSADQAANYVEYQFQVPEDFDNGVDLRARLKFVLGNTDTAAHRHVLSHASVADSAVASSATLLHAVNVDLAGDGSGAASDMQTTAWTTLTSWKSDLTAGQTWRIRLARDGDDGTNDASTVDSTERGLVIEYGITQ